ncbi:MAG: hypothetical protein JSR65_03805, partial [Proteobacteria bacterium]|nr:hypothetical protein [Pseudomonadota bacterium]
DAARRTALRERIDANNAMLFDGAGVIAALEDFLDAATRQAAAQPSQKESPPPSHA